MPERRMPHNPTENNVMYIDYAHRTETCVDSENVHMYGVNYRCGEAEKNGCTSRRNTLHCSGKHTMCMCATSSKPGRNWGYCCIAVWVISMIICETNVNSGTARLERQQKARKGDGRTSYDNMTVRRKGATWPEHSTRTSLQVVAQLSPRRNVLHEVSGNGEMFVFFFSSMESEEGEHPECVMRSASTKRILVASRVPLQNLLLPSASQESCSLPLSLGPLTLKHDFAVCPQVLYGTSFIPSWGDVCTLMNNLCQLLAPCVKSWDCVASDYRPLQRNTCV